MYHTPYLFVHLLFRKSSIACSVSAKHYYNIHTVGWLRRTVHVYSQNTLNRTMETKETSKPTTMNISSFYSVPINTQCLVSTSVDQNLARLQTLTSNALTSKRFEHHFTRNLIVDGAAVCKAGSNVHVDAPCAHCPGLAILSRVPQ